MKKEKTDKSSKHARWLNLLVTFFLIFSVLLSMFVAVQVLAKGYVNIGGYSVFRIVTGSMEPTMPIGCLLINKQVDIEEVEVDDIVCFRAKEAAIFGKVITHRVVGTFVGDDGRLYLETKGDANLSVDPYLVNEDNFIGKVTSYTGENNLLADIVSLFSNKLGFLGLVVFPCLVFAVIILRSSISSIRKELIEVLEESAAAAPEPVNSDLPLGMTQQEYEEMYARIRDELIKELMEEIKQSENTRLQEQKEN